MLDLSKLEREELPYYNVETVPATAYPQLVQGDKPVSTLAVHNLLMVRADMPAGRGQALVRSLFDAQPNLSPDVEPGGGPASQLIDQRLGHRDATHPAARRRPGVLPLSEG